MIKTASATVATETPVILRVPPSAAWDDEQFFLFCQANRDWGFERTAEGDIVILTPSGGETGWRNSEINLALRLWAKQAGSGEVFDSSTGFVLGNGAVRSPDAAWVRRERLRSLTRRQWQRFLPLCPDFVMELRSPSDPLPPLRAKMEEYLAQGAQLGWLIDPERQVVEVFRPNLPPMLLDQPPAISGDPILPGFVLDLTLIWQGPLPFTTEQAE